MSGTQPSGHHLRCPFCETYEVDRLYLGSLRLDSCACASCGARWEEDPLTGEFRGRTPRQGIDHGTGRSSG